MYHPKIKHLGRRNCCECDCDGGHFGRSFFSKEEKMEKLRKYREQLEKEISGIDAHIQELDHSK